jgi:hypothetical protein
MHFPKHVLAVAVAFSIAAVPGWAQVANSSSVPSAAANSATQKAMGNADVIALAAAGLPDDIVIAKIQAASLTNFDTSLDGLKSLRAAHVSDAVIRVMIDPHAASATLTPVPSGLPTEDGVYYKKQGVYTEIEPQVAKFRMGMLKMMATGGMLKTNVKGRIDGTRSATSVVAPLEFVIVLPDGVGLAEFQLLRLIEKSNYREFSTTTGGLLQSSNGVSPDAIKFDGRKIAPRTFAVTLPPGLQAGEYGFLPPRGAIESNSVESTGRIYAFHITD